MSQIEPYLLNLAGEYRVCSEINKRGILATITYGTHKGADIYAITKRRSMKIEVKASQRDQFVTNFSRKDDNPNSLEFWSRQAENLDAPEFWVFVQIFNVGETDSFQERFFVLSHKELCAVQSARNTTYAANYLERHGKEWDFSKGVDNVKIADIEPFENQWSKIINAFTSEV